MLSTGKNLKCADFKNEKVIQVFFIHMHNKGKKGELR
jgi:hypothetical protein